MYIEQLIDSIKKRPKMYVNEEKIEYIFHYILGYSSACHKFSPDDIDKMFCNWFWKWLVKWIKDNIDICREQCNYVYEQMSSWMRLFDEREQQHNDMPLLFEVDLHQKAEAKSYRKDILSILNLREEKNVLGMTARRKLLVKVNNRSALQQIARRFDANAYSVATTKVLRAYASIESVGLFQPAIEKSASGQLLKIKLADYGNEH